MNLLPTSIVAEFWTYNYFNKTLPFPIKSIKTIETIKMVKYMKAIQTNTTDKTI